MASAGRYTLTNGQHENLPTFSASQKIWRICAHPFVLPCVRNILLHRKN